MAVVPGCTAVKVPVPTEEASMAERAAKPENPEDKVSPGKKLDPPDQATAAGRAKSHNSAGQRDTASSKDEVQPKFREALERKRAREAGTMGAPRGKDAGKVHDAHGPATNRRSFRRKSG
jgi:hypothetical protein